MRTLLCTGFLLCSLPLAGLLNGQDKPKETAATTTVKPEKRTHVRLGGIMVGVGYTRFSGPFYGYPFGYYPGYWGAFGPGYWPFWDLYLPMYYPGFFPPYYSLTPGANMGEIKLRAFPRDAEVLLDGAYAGKATDLKSFWLKPGAYHLEVRADNRVPFSRRVYILSGKTLKIDTSLQEAKP